MISETRFNYYRFRNDTTWPGYGTAESHLDHQCECAHSRQLPALRRTVELRYPASTSLGLNHLSIGYIGSKTTHLDNTIELNNPRSDSFRRGATDTIQSRRPYPFIVDKGVTRPLSRIRFLDSGGNSWYDGLQGQLPQTLLAWPGAHVCLHVVEDPDAGLRTQRRRGVNSNTYEIKFDRASEKGRVGFDASHVVVSKLRV